MNIKFLSKLLFAFLILQFAVYAQRELGVRPTDSGGVLMPEQAAYDVKHYDLSVTPNIEEQSIKGVLIVTAQIVKPIDKFVLDLDQAFTVESVSVVIPIVKEEISLKFEHKGGKIWIDLGKKIFGGKIDPIKIVYSGKPKVAPAPPWVGGFVWSKTPSGAPWIATAVQMDGSDLWFPVKDHPSDKAETTSLHFTVPANLVAASNGKLQSVVDNKDGTKTYNWFVSQPISNYNIALNIAPYKIIEDKMQSVAGNEIPIVFYVLPEHADKGRELIDKTKDYVRFFEEYLGPFPFRADKLGIAHTPHLGMEHQSIIAYGNDFKYDKNGFDWLMFHELGHEWWANLVTAPDWNDFWIHEGFQSFMDTLFLEKKLGKLAYFNAMKGRAKNTRNIKAVAPREPRTTTEMYLLPPDYVKSDGDIYGKGAVVLHTLRYYIGDKAFFRSLRRMAYPDPKMEKVTSGKQPHFATTDDFLQIAERESGKDLDWFFNLYLRQPELPVLHTEKKENQLFLRWTTPDKNSFPLKDYIVFLKFLGLNPNDPMPFPMPVEVSINGEIKKVEMTNGVGSAALPPNAKYEIDPNGWILKAQ